MFPPLSTEWLAQMNDQRDWSKFQKEDFERLRQKYGVTWAVIEQPGRAGMTCPYSNAAVLVCRVE